MMIASDKKRPPSSSPDLQRSGLEDRAHKVAEQHKASRQPGATPTPLDRLSTLQQVLRRAHAVFLERSEERGTLSGVAEWLLDNFYVLQQAVRQVRENMPLGYYQRLPKLDDGPLEGYPRVYALAREIIRAADGHVDIAQLKRFVRSYQEVRPLTMGEIWALPTMLRLSLLEVLTRIVAEPLKSDPSFADFVPVPFEGHKIPGPALPSDRADEAIVADAINGLRAIDAQDWDAFFEAISLVEGALGLDPLGVYADMDFDSRDRYRGVVEALARAVDRSEQEVAQEAVRLAEEARPAETSRAGRGGGRVERSDPVAGDHLRAQHVGYYLVDEGRRELEEAIGFQTNLAERVRRWIFAHATSVYLGAIFLVTVLILSGALAYAHSAGAGAAALVVTGVLSLVPASVVGVNVVNTIITRTVPTRVLPRFDFGDGIPDAYRTMVVLPVLLTSEDEIEFLLGQLERHYVGNKDPQFGFALLTDFADASEKHMPEDEDLLQQAKDGIRELNRKYRQDGTEERGGSASRDGPFYLFHRERLWNPSETCWMGWERKRGKLVEFNHLIRGDEGTSYVVQMGGLDFLSGIEYVITLDADTVFPRDAGCELVGTLAHPLNRAQFAASASGSDERVVAGYTVLQPRTEVKPTAVTQTWFTRIFAGDAGLDLYTRAVSDVYQDFFGEGIYIGKGIYDVDAFERSLKGRVPENALLSHDLFEGVHGRAALVSDVVLLEDYPPSYLSYAHRKHRWVRGDWQILPWLLPRVPHAGEGTIPNRLSILDRWKILDNLRRSLRPLALLALLVAGWLFLPGSPVLWTLGALASSAMPLVTGAVTEITRRLQGGRPERDGAPMLGEMGVESARWLLSLAFLPYQSILMFDAIVTTLVRLTISRRRLLQWTTAAHTVRLFGRESKIALLWRRMSGGPVLGFLTAVALILIRPTAIPLAAPLVVSWLISPAIAARISRRRERKGEPLSAGERQELRRIARRTWLYFERFVGPDDHWLPPDHFQEDPRGTVAHRTSPTNVGLMLLSSLSAYDLGYIGLMELSLRVNDAFDAMDQLERYRGHFLNWYDTRSLDTLAPRYVSTVDSGNLAACLVVLRQGLERMGHQRVLRWRRWRGLCDTLGVLREIVEGVEQREELKEEAAAVAGRIDHIQRTLLSVREDPERWVAVLPDLEEEIGGELHPRLQTLLDAGSGILDTATLRDLRLWSERIHLHLRDVRQEVERIVPWVASLTDAPTILAEEKAADLPPAIAEAWQRARETLRSDPRVDGVSGICRQARRRLRLLRNELEELQSLDQGAGGGRADELRSAIAWADELDERLKSARMTAGGMMIGLHDLVERAETYVEAMDFGFLYDEHRDVFCIGYQVDSEELDRNHYDLLASEARIASVVAISKGDVPQRHWLHLNRPLTSFEGRRALLSWGGSMFEYLMPNLMMRTYEETLLEQASRAAVLRQIGYAQEKGVPWGVSESGYYRFDAQMNYQYRGFGVPGLGRKRGLGDDLVIAPYASLLAVGILPRDVLENARRLAQEGMLGHYGFYEALDCTEARLPMGQARAIVRSYMAHHQGMIMAALSNYLDDNGDTGPGIVCRFHDDPRIQSVEFLLQEQVPHQAPLEEIAEEAIGIERPKRERVELEPWSVPMDAALPQVNFLSNGRYGLLITESGAGYSTYSASRSQEGETQALTRWRADTTRDCWGTWIYVQDRDGGRPDDVALWSAADQPTGVRPAEQQVRFYPYQAEFHSRYDEVSLHTEITVAAEDDVEIRRVTLTNHGDETQRLRISSYGEVVLASQDRDRRHPAFNKMFIESEYAADINGLLFTRRPRSGEEEPLHMAHLLVTEADLEATRAYESDRARFIGRGGTVERPAAFRRVLEGDEWLSGTTGSTLDPVMAVGQELDIQPHTAVQLAYLTLVAESRDDAVALARRYRSWSRINRAFDQAHAQSEVELRNLDLEVGDVEDITRLLSALMYPHRSLRPAPGTLAANRLGQSGLWRYGISGDYPILLVRLGREEDLPLIRELLRAHAYWRDRQLKIDLVIVNQKAAGYAQELSDRLSQVIAQMDSEAWLNRRGGIFVVGADQMDEASRVLLETAARAVLDAGEGSLHEQLEGLLQRPSRLPALQPSGGAEEPEPTPAVKRPDDLQFDNGFGGFSHDGREYVVYLDSGAQSRDGDTRTPAPWINVISNRGFGCLVSETGLGYTWAVNSGENRLTPWGNDPVSNQPPEALYLRDEETGAVWTSTPLPAGDDAPFLIRHGAGYSVFEHNSHGLKQRLQVFVAPEAPVKVIRLRLENTWDRVRRLTATFFAQWVLGVHRDQSQQYVISQYDPETSALLARNTYNPAFGEREGSEAAVAFLASSEEPHSLTADRAEFLGRRGKMRHPAALDRVGLGSGVEPGLDPAAAMQLHVELDPGEAKEIFFLLGQGESRSKATDVIKAYRDGEEVAAAWDRLQDRWDGLLGTVSVDTPDPAMDLMLNRWLLYQALSCRVWGRSALYQSSGAFGFRDQLQDVMSLLHAAPEVAREHILRAARHQFEAGDVLHWWHPPSGRGVRTRISDDLLWLPFVVAEYVETTGDDGILDQELPFRRGEPLDVDEEERYGRYDLTEEKATLYEHCLRALNEGSTSGRHGLPLIGAGDWNDGLNRVGVEGRGESIWLGWFLYATLTQFARVCERTDDSDQAGRLRQQAEELGKALEMSAWDGDWYMRAIYDNGSPLGSSKNAECKIASMAQSWAVLSGAGDTKRTEQAMAAVADWLVREDDEHPPGLILLFTPPFDETPQDPGYIKGYPPGIRENGGQYTHAALWAVWAYTEMGQGDRAGKLFRLLNPVHHSDAREKARRYQVEPYVVAADVYSADGHVGRGGWTWYTGSSGWMYRLGLEAILGLRRRGDTLRIEPCIPSHWPGYQLVYRHGETTYQIKVENPEGVCEGVRRVTLDGKALAEGRIPLVRDGDRHQVRVTLG